MVKLVNRAKMTTDTTGTGTITLGAAVSGFQTFTGAGVVDGDLVRYVIEEGDNFEIGTGVFGSAGGTLTRNPSESSAGGGAITLTGNALVFVGAASADVQSNVTVTGGTIDGTVIGGSTPAAISGTTGSFSGNLTVDTNTLFVDAANNRVGIGTSSPLFSLDVSSSLQTVTRLASTSTTGFIDIRASGTTPGHVRYAVTGNDAFIMAGNSERLRITSTGNVGIGTSSPDQKLTLDNAGVLISAANVSSTQKGTIQLQNTGATQAAEAIGNAISFSGINTSRRRAMIASYQDGANGNPTGLAFYTYGANTTATDEVPERLRITSAGNVGIGTSSPDERLHVIGSAKLDTGSAAANPRLYLDHDTVTDDANYIQLNRGDASLEVISEDNVKIRTNGSERMRITSTGNVGIGTSSPATSLDVVGAGRFTRGLELGINGVNATAYIGQYRSGVETIMGPLTTRMLFGTVSNHDVAFLTNNTERLRITSAGNVGIGTSSPSEKLSVTGNVTISGSLSKGSGSFRIDHPIKPDTHHLVHSFIEGPQADNLYRGKVSLVDGIATVNLDEAGRMTEGTFVALNGNVQCFTANEAGWTQVRGKVEGNILTIEAQDTACTDEVSWLVIGERHDPHMIDANWTDDQGRVITEPEKVIDIELETNND